MFLGDLSLITEPLLCVRAQPQQLRGGQVASSSTGKNPLVKNQQFFEAKAS